ncbi:MAG TPA: hypothetical protein VG994_02585 [Steroidobacteraceae bacterium]|nr:hypothetical protein [Steroidobacteraceae bacterium]
MVRLRRELALVDMKRAAPRADEAHRDWRINRFHDFPLRDVADDPEVRIETLDKMSS